MGHALQEDREYILRRNYQEERKGGSLKTLGSQEGWLTSAWKQKIDGYPIYKLNEPKRKCYTLTLTRKIGSILKHFEYKANWGLF